MTLISILIPCYNEEDNVLPMAAAVKEQMSNLPQYEYELIFIDNHSTDGTREKLRSICSDNKHVKAIFNARNYGQFTSPYYGILQASGDCVITMCCDFQDPVELIPKYIEEWEKGNKIILGQRTSAKENPIVYRSRLYYYRFMRRHSDIDFMEQVTGSGLYDRSFIEVMRKTEDPRPFLRGMVAELGYGVKLIPYEQPKRRAGKSHNSLFSYLDGAAQSLTAYTKFGCRLALGCGVVATIASFITILGFIIYKILNWDSFPIENYALTLAIILLCSMNMFFIGVVGEYVMDANIHTRKRPLVVEEERINF